MAITVQAFAGLAFLVGVLGLALFAGAGTLAYWQAWVFLCVFSSIVTAITLDLARRDPALLARRVQVGPVAERTAVQKLIQSCASLAFIAIFVVSALDHRHGWSRLPNAVVAVGNLLVALGLFFVFRVFRANTFTSATIEVAAEQGVISTGPYALVRHPMYSGALLFVLGTPLALGSYFGIIGVPLLALVIVWRLLDEEKYLAEHLRGYDDYRRQVRYRLVPHVW
jgi:protein-S-isoprenylcysteine O-methyltransferase Ste14